MAAIDIYVAQIISACGRLRDLVLTTSLISAVLLAGIYINYFSWEAGEHIQAPTVKNRLEGYLKTETNAVQIEMMRAEVARLTKLIAEEPSRSLQLPILGIDLSPTNLNILGALLLFVLYVWISISLRQLVNAIRAPGMIRELEAYLPTIRLALDTVVGDMMSIRSAVPTMTLLLLPLMPFMVFALVEPLLQSYPLYMFQRHDPQLDFLLFRQHNYFLTMRLLALLQACLSCRVLWLRHSLVRNLRRR